MGLLGNHGEEPVTSTPSTDSASSTASCLPYLQISPTQPIAGPYDFYHFNIILSGAAFGFVTIVIFALMFLHIRHLSKPREQVHILRVCLFMPVYALGCFIMVIEPNAYVYLKPWLKLLEAYALAYFFLLVGQMISPEDASDSETMLAPLMAMARQKNLNPQAMIKKYRTQWLFIYQAPIVLFLVAIATDIAQGVKGYCSETVSSEMTSGVDSGSSSKSKIDTVLTVIGLVSLILAVLGVIRQTMRLKKELTPHKGQIKLWAFKALIGLQIIQEIIFLIMSHVEPSPLEPSATMSYIDLEQGVPLLMILLEMVLFSILYHYAYTASPYIKTSKVSGSSPGGFRVWIEILKINQLFHALTFGFRIQNEYNRLEDSYRRGARRPSQRYSEEEMNANKYQQQDGAGAPPGYRSV